MNAERRLQNAKRRSGQAIRAMVLAGCALFASHATEAGSQSVATHAALSTVSPYATQIGLNVLKHGGNAIDAAVAVSFALAVAHPQAGNIAGGGFLVYYEARTKSVWTLDYREVAPLAAKRDMYIQADGKPSMKSQVGPLAGAVPGALAGLDAMHKKFGSKSWKELVEPAIHLAFDGVRVDSEMAADLADEQKKRKIDQFTSTAAIFYPDGKPLPVGATFVQKDLVATLQRIATFGSADFYNGQTGDRFVEGVRASGGIIAYRDLREYKPIWRSPIKLSFGEYDIYTMAPPGAGAIVIGESLNILSGYDLAAAGFQTPKSLHLIAEAERRAYIDRNKYIGDPATTRIPYAELLSADRARQWRNSILPARVTPTTTLTEPGGAMSEGNHTTHFTIADAEGNVAAITTTLNDNFGSGFLVPGCGCFLNNEMDDFTTVPGKPNLYGLVQGPVNAIEPGKRMASSMSPTIVLKGGKPFLALGTRGGATIPTSVLQVFLNVVVYKKLLYDAIAAPRWHEQAFPEEVFYEKEAPPATVAALSAMGHATREREPIGDIHAIMFDKGRIIAVADPRHSGAAGGY